MLSFPAQAFSHFTYCKTLKAERGPKLIVDIQGVANADKTLYQLTDPPVHCAEHDGRCYGDTNNGSLGIEQFFDSHQCNDVCRSLGLIDRPGSSNCV